MLTGGAADDDDDAVLQPSEVGGDAAAAFAEETTRTRAYSSSSQPRPYANDVTPSPTSNFFGQASLDAYATSFYEGVHRLDGAVFDDSAACGGGNEHEHHRHDTLAQTPLNATTVLTDVCGVRNSRKSDMGENDRSIATLGGVQAACTPSDQLLCSSTRSELYGGCSPHPHSGTTAVVRCALPYSVLPDGEYGHCEISACGHDHDRGRYQPGYDGSQRSRSHSHSCSNHSEHVSDLFDSKRDRAGPLLSHRVYRCLYDSFNSAAHAREGDAEHEGRSKECMVQADDGNTPFRRDVWNLYHAHSYPDHRAKSG